MQVTVDKADLDDLERAANMSETAGRVLSQLVEMILKNKKVKDEIIIPKRIREKSVGLRMNIVENDDETIIKVFRVEEPKKTEENGG